MREAQVECVNARLLRARVLKRTLLLLYLTFRCLRVALFLNVIKKEK